jgi:hypothetical protein
MSGIVQAAAAFVAALAAADLGGLSDAERIDELTALESVKAAAAARQARVTDAFARSQRARLVAAGSSAAEVSRSVCAQVGLARRDSPTKGNRHVGLARALVRELPGVLRVLERGQTSEWRVTVIARETAHLSVEQRAEVDAAIAGELAGWGDARTEREARAWAQRLDPHGAAERAAKAAADRRVTVRSAPDCMTYVSALLPVKDGVAVFGQLHRAALAGAVDVDEHRSRGQIMADELVRRVLTPAEGAAEVPGVEVHLVMTDRALADADDEPAQLVGIGPIPAPVARDLVRADERTKVWVRRLYTDPATGALAATDARRRDFPHVARMFLTARDQVCRTPWCGAPIRHADHAVAVAKGGETDMRNGNGRCARCNLTKDQRGWATKVRDGTIVTTTPTGHRYVSRPPRPPTSRPWIPAFQVDLQWPGTGTSG